MLLCTLFTKHLALLLFIFFFSPSLHPLSSLSASLPLKVRHGNQSVCTWRKLGVSKSRGYVVCEVCWNGGIHLLAGWGTLENSYLISWSRVQSNLLESPRRWWHVALTQASMGPLGLGVHLLYLPNVFYQWTIFCSKLSSQKLLVWASRRIYLLQFGQTSC